MKAGPVQMAKEKAFMTQSYYLLENFIPLLDSKKQKMKRAYCFLIFLIALAGCDQIRDAATVIIKTHFETTIPVIVTSQGLQAFSFDAAGVPVNFSITQDLFLEDNFDITPYLAKIKRIDMSKIGVTVTGLTSGQTINTVSIDVEGVGNIITKTGISMTNNTFTPLIASSLFDKVAAKLLEDRKVTVTVSGAVSEPMSFNVGVNIDADVVAYLLN